ncbi:MAG: peptide-binding protein [Nitrospirae bacterium]|nr:peptide-binding protein [Nitrospirota bacterium]
MRKPIFAIAALALVLAASSCAKKQADAPIPNPNPNTITVAALADAKRLIPMLATDTASSDISGWMFNGLTKYDKDIKIIGDLAESWDVSPDGMVITFHLRKNVKWHDGEPFTSADVLFTYNTLRDPKVATPYSDSLGPVGRVEAPDEYTVKVTYKEPFAPALEAWGMGIIPKHLLEGRDINTDEFNRHPVGTGPFKFEEWAAGQKVVLTAFDEYFEGRPKVDKFITRIIPDTSTMFLELKSGGIDYMGLTPLQYSRQVDDTIEGRFSLLRYPSFAYTYMGYNLNDEKFKDKRVRQAISYAVDQQSIIDGVLLGLGMPCTGPFPPESWAYNPDVKPYPHDVGKAKALLAEAGWKDTDGDGILDKDGKPFAFTILTNQGNDQRKKTGEIIQQNLKEVGVSVKLNTLEWQALLHDFIDKRKFEAIILGWALSRDPDSYDMWYSTKTKEGEFNFVGYSNPEVDRLLIEGRQTFDIKKRTEIYRKIHAILADDVPYTFLYVPDALPVLHKRFKGVKKEPLGIWYNFKDWTVPADKNQWYE